MYEKIQELLRQAELHDIPDEMFEELLRSIALPNKKPSDD